MMVFPDAIAHLGTEAAHFNKAKKHLPLPHQLCQVSKQDEII